MSHVTRVNESCYMYDMSRNESRDIYKHGSRHTYEMSHVTLLCTHTWNMPLQIWEWCMSRIDISHVKRMNKSCFTYEISHVLPRDTGRDTRMKWVMSPYFVFIYARYAPCNMCVVRVMYRYESCHAHEWVVLYVWNQSRYTYRHGSRHTYEMGHVTLVRTHKWDVSLAICVWCVSRINMSHTPRMNESCCTYKRSPFTRLVLHVRKKSFHTNYGVASVSRIDKIIGLYCKRAL